jgi:hypothetical protein
MNGCGVEADFRAFDKLRAGVAQDRLNSEEQPQSATLLNLIRTIHASGVSRLTHYSTNTAVPLAVTISIPFFSPSTS